MDGSSEVQSVFGADYWKYRIEETGHELEAMARYVVEDGLALRLVRLEELIAPSTHPTFRN